jgi:hypothetical protein
MFFPSEFNIANVYIGIVDVFVSSPARTGLRYLKYPKKSATLIIAPTINATAMPA